jgi:hypothetical protein
MDKILHLRTLGISGIGLLVSALMLVPQNSANATCATCQTYQQALEIEFSTHEAWMSNEWWSGYVEPGLERLTDEIRNALSLEVAAIGTFFDAQNEMGAMRALQEITATTMKNYAVSDTICEFGTLSRSLAASQAKGKNNQLVLSERSQNRQLGQYNMAAAEGSQQDRSTRLTQFRADYCDPADFGTGMSSLCNGTATDDRQNIDINFTRAVDTKPTLNVDFTNAAVTNDEKDIIALANNLYAHKLFDRINVDSLNSDQATDTQSSYLDQRSIVAKRSVAENSFNELVGEKSAGTEGSRTYLLQVLRNLGLSNADAAKYVGENPSYDAQMEILTKKLYQDPAFYANLMDSPANVNRQYAALQSFGLMQKRDIFETIMRSEILLSMVLEMEISKYQDDIQNRQNSQ